MAKQRRNAQRDLETFNNRAFRSKIGAELIHQLHQLLSMPEHERDAAWFDLLCAWMTIPYTLWPGDFAGFTEHICCEYSNGRPLWAQAKRILRNFTPLPSSELIQVVAEDEFEVKAGNYDQFLTEIALAKYYAAEKELLSNPEVHLRIAEFFEQNPDFGAGKKVVRRRMSMERNFRPHRWEYDPADPLNITQLEFDSLCYYFQLFGVERNADGTFKPLLQKLSINTTAWGISIVIPRYWSFDNRRDIKWSEFMKVQRARAAKKTGEKRAKGGIFTNENAINAANADDEALERDMKGDVRFAYVEARAKLRKMSRRNLQKLISMGRKLREPGT